MGSFGGDADEVTAAFAGLSDREQAKNLLERVLLLAPNAAAALHGMAVINDLAGNKKSAEAYLKAALAAEPFHDASHRDLFHLMIEMGRWRDVFRVVITCIRNLTERQRQLTEAQRKLQARSRTVAAAAAAGPLSRYTDC